MGGSSIEFPDTNEKSMERPLRLNHMLEAIGKIAKAINKTKTDGTI